ncbi:MAG: CBS domain-containing protein [Flavobacteriaceae bacterium]
MAVKSFQGPRAISKKIKPTNLLVRDIMTKNIVRFNEDQTIHDVMDALVKNRISGGPVVNKNNQLIGIISEGDCMKEISDSRYFNMPILDKSVGYFMTKDVQTLPATMSLFDAASMFHKTGRRRFPVLDNGNLVGQVSRKDIVIAAANLRGATWHQL